MKGSFVFVFAEGWGYHFSRSRIECWIWELTTWQAASLHQTSSHSPIYPLASSSSNPSTPFSPRSTPLTTQLAPRIMRSSGLPRRAPDAPARAGRSARAHHARGGAREASRARGARSARAGPRGPGRATAVGPGLVDSTGRLCGSFAGNMWLACQMDLAKLVGQELHGIGPFRTHRFGRSNELLRQEHPRQPMDSFCRFLTRVRALSGSPNLVLLV